MSKSFCYISLCISLFITFSVHHVKSVVNVNKPVLLDVTGEGADPNMKHLGLTSTVLNSKHQVLHSISRFLNIEHLTIIKYNITTVPKMFDIPMLRDIKITRTNISRIRKSDFEQINPSVIYLNQNKIVTIDDRAFRNIIILNLDCNQLQTINSNWFMFPKVLDTLSVHGNNITTLKPNTFDNFIALRSLILSSNKLKHLPTGIFPFTHMSYLDLNHNELYELPVNIFSQQNIIIYWFGIDYNRLSFLNPELFTRMKIRTLNMIRNPWQCPCLRQIETLARDKGFWIKAVDDYQDDLPVCVSAVTFKRNCVQFVDEELYQLFVNNPDVKKAYSLVNDVCYSF